MFSIVIMILCFKLFSNLRRIEFLTFNLTICVWEMIDRLVCCFLKDDDFWLNWFMFVAWIKLIVTWTVSSFRKFFWGTFIFFIDDSFDQLFHGSLWSVRTFIFIFHLRIQSWKGCIRVLRILVIVSMLIFEIRVYFHFSHVICELRSDESNIWRIKWLKFLMKILSCWIQTPFFMWTWSDRHGSWVKRLLLWSINKAFWVLLCWFLSGFWSS